MELSVADTTSPSLLSQRSTVSSGGGGGGTGSFFAFFAATMTSITLTMLLVAIPSNSQINHGSDTFLVFAMILLATVFAIFVSLDESM